MPENDLHYETKARKIMVDFKFVAHTGKSSKTASRSRVSRKVIRKFVLVGRAVCTKPTESMLLHSLMNQSQETTFLAGARS